MMPAHTRFAASESLTILRVSPRDFSMPKPVVVGHAGGRTEWLLQFAARAGAHQLSARGIQTDHSCVLDPVLDYRNRC